MSGSSKQQFKSGKPSKRKTAVITGAARGIGYGIALRLAREGYDIAILDVLAENEVDRNITRLRKQKTSLLYYQGDLACKKDRKEFCQQIIDEFGSIDVLVNNAGIAPRERKDLLEMTEKSFDRVLGINLKGTFFLTQRVARLMITGDNKKSCENWEVSSSQPRIINIASISSYTASPSRGQYCISKAGISMVTRLFATRLAAEGILVYEIRPGIIETSMTGAVKEKYDHLIEQGLTPIKRWGQPEDIARAVSVLCSGKLDFSTGEVLNVDGGFHLRRL